MSDKIIDVESLPATREQETNLPDSKRLVILATERAKHMEIIHKLALSVTHPEDWVDYGGKPGMSGPGAERIMRTFGLKTYNTQRQKIVNEDGSYVWQKTGRVGPNEHETVDVIGTCSSDKPFFSVRNKEIIPLSERDESSMIKNADTNFIVNGVSRFLGLRGLTWEQLERLSEGKLKKSGAQKVDYGSGKTERNDEENAKAKLIWQWLLEMNGGSVSESKKQLQKITKFNDFKGYTDINKVSANVIKFLYPKVEKMINDWGKEGDKKEESGKAEQQKLFNK